MTESRTQRREKREAKVFERTRKSRTWRLRISIMAVLMLVFGYHNFFGQASTDVRTTKHAMAVRVQDSSGKAMKDVLVQFYRKGTDLLAPSHEARTDADGLARLPIELSDGSYLCVGRSADGTSSMTEIDRSGRFELSGISKSLPALRLRARAKGYADKDLEWERSSGENPLIELEPSMPLLLEILMPDGSPASGIPVTIKRRPELTTKSDADGLCQIAGLSMNEDVPLRIIHEQFTYRLSHALRPGQDRVRLRLEEPLTLQGRVVDSRGIGISDVELRHDYGPSGWPNGWTRTRSGEQGRFRLAGLPSGDLVFIYELPGGESEQASVRLEAGQSRKDFVLRVRKD